MPGIVLLDQASAHRGGCTAVVQYL